jgi:alpha-beta hydrolase superfamily lysophospholipase
MQCYEEDLIADDGLRLHVYRWLPQDAHGAIVLSHGWSEHAGRYHDLANWFVSQGFEVHGLDHRGHGKSDGRRGHVNSWYDYTRDLECLRRTIDNEHQYIVAHSMGAMIASLHMLEFPGVFRAAALSGPASDVSYPVPALKRYLGLLMSAWFPALTLKNHVDPKIICGNQIVVDAYQNDPLNHGVVSARWFADYLKQIERLKEQAHTIQTPVGIWHGDGDELVASWVGKEFFERLNDRNKKFCLVKDALHEILFEDSWPQTAEEMKLWLEQY